MAEKSNPKNEKEDKKEEDFFTAVPPSPPKMVRMEEVMKMRSKVENMILSHEIAMKDDFKLQKKEVPAESLEGRVRAIMEKAFWNILEEELNETPPKYDQALNLLTEIKQELHDILPQTAQSMRTMIDEVLDLDLIRQKLQHDAFDLASYSRFIIEVLEKSCAPARDQQVAQLKHIQEVVPLYQQIFQVLSVMKLDLANFTIEVAKPILKQHSTDIERKQFFEILQMQQANGVDGLLSTKRWLVNAFHHVLKRPTASPSSSSSQPSSSPSQPPSSSSQPPSSSSSQPPSSSSQPPSSSAPAPPINPSHLLHSTMCEAYLTLLFTDISLPETLLVDAERLLDLKNSLGTLLFIGVALVVSSASLARPLDQPLKHKLKHKLLLLFQQPVIPAKDQRERFEGLSEEVVGEVEGWMGEKGERMSTDTRTSLKTQLTNCLDPSSSPSPVLKLLTNRLKAFFQQILSSNTTTNFPIPQGFSTISEELTSLAGTFVQVITHNQSVYRIIYNDLITDLIKKHHNSTSSSTTTATATATATATTTATTSGNQANI